MTVPTLSGPRDRIEAAVTQIREALRKLMIANEILVAVPMVTEPRGDLTAVRVDLARVIRRLEEARDEMTPVRPSSASDLKAAFANAENFARRK